jgi:protease-4
MTKEERELLQALIDDAYSQFLTAVATGRKIPEEQVRPLADGRIFSGNQALQAKLVDKLGDSTDAIERAAALAHITGKPRIKRDTERISDFFDMLDSRFEGALTGTPPWIESLKPRVYTGLEYRWSGG